MKKCFLFHKWIIVKDNGFTKYFKCKRCGLKKVKQKIGGYQPIDLNYEKI